MEKRVMRGLLAAIFLTLASKAGAAGCVLGFTAKPQAVTLSVTTITAQRIRVGTVNQNCNGNVSYTLVVESADCLLSPAGAKLMDMATLEHVRYSVEFVNPSGAGNAPSVTGLLASACSNAVGRDVNHDKITNQTSAVFINFTGAATLAAGTYSDTLTVILNLN